MENISEIKSGFIDYLKDKYGDEESSKIKSYSPELSIFMYSSDFQQYLVGNGYADVSVFSKSISEIKDMLSSGENKTEADAPNEEGVNESPDVNTGENVIQNNNTNGMNQVGDSFLITALTDVVNNDQDLFSAFNTNSNGTIDAEEITAFLDSVEAAMQADPDSYETIFDGIAKGIQEIKGAETSPESILESIYESEEALEYLDLDGDGKISDLEKELFESYVQGDNEELNAEDLQKVLEQMKNGTFDYDVELPEDALSVKDIPETVAAESPESDGNISARQTSNPTQSLSSTGRTSSGASASSSPQQSVNSDPDKMSLDELKKEQQTRQSNVDSAKEDVDNTLSEITDVEEGEYAEAKKAYDDAVENDENIDDELKEKRSNNLEAIETKTGEIDSLNSQIAETEVSLGKANDKLDADNKTLSALKSALSSYNSTSSDDSEQNAEIEAAKAKIQGQIDELEQNTIPADEEERDRLDKLLNGGGESEGLKEQLKTKEQELADLEKTRTEIETEIASKGSKETKQALEDFQTVKQKLDDLRAKLPDAQEALVKAQEELTEINEQIRTKEAEELESENTFYDGSLPSELVSALDSQLGAGFCKKLEQVAKNINCDPKDLLGMMQSESGINPAAYNNNGGATGLIQFMPSTAKSLGTTTQALLNMSAVEQLDYVEKYFTNWTGGSGQRLSGGDLYTLCFLPAYLNQEILCSSSGSTSVYYNANSGLDADGDGNITKTELSNRVSGKYQEVLSKYGISG